MSSCGSLHARRLLLTCCLAALPGQLYACAACYGRSDSRLAEGMNWGILSLLVVVAGVLAGFAAFFIYHLRRASLSGRGEPQAQIHATVK